MLLHSSSLPGTVLSTAGFRSTACKPSASEAILRIINGQTDPDVIKAAEARAAYQQAILNVLKRLSARDFEELIDMVLNRRVGPTSPR
jgi:restriction endonuclease Mrr